MEPRATERPSGVAWTRDDPDRTTVRSSRYGPPAHGFSRKNPSLLFFRVGGSTRTPKKELRLTDQYCSLAARAGMRRCGNHSRSGLLDNQATVACAQPLTQLLWFGVASTIRPGAFSTNALTFFTSRARAWIGPQAGGQ